LDKEIVKQLLLDAGITPLDEDINMTVDLLEALGEQMAKALPKLMENVEPHYIQPTRPEQI
jgi:hypothetical protein